MKSPRGSGSVPSYLKVSLFIAVLSVAGATAWSDPGDVSVPQAVARVEQWACPSENEAAFRDYVASVWTPLFDAMVEEGLFTSWAGMYPVQARDVVFGDSIPSVVEDTASWTWMGVWQGESQEAFDASWREYHRRLKITHPDGVGPELLCGRVRVSTFVHDRRGAR